MILRLDPRHPLVWRTPTSAQLGIDPPLVHLEQVSELQERMLAALAVGVSRPGLTMIAGGPGAEPDALLATVSSVLLGPAIERVDSVALSGRGALREPLARALAESGVHVTLGADAADLAEQRPDLAILVHDYVTPPAVHGLWLRRDVPHLPVVSTDGGVSVGPLVQPGTGPCLLCLELHRRDADPAWPAIATQLLGRTPEVPPMLALEGAAVACRLVLEYLDTGAAAALSVRIDAATGDRHYRQWDPHPECGCRGIDLLVEPQPEPATAGRRETDWAGAVLDPVPR